MTSLKSGYRARMAESEHIDDEELRRMVNSVLVDPDEDEDGSDDEPYDADA